MNPPRFTVSGLLWTVAGFSCVCAGLRFATNLWTNAIATATYLLLMTGVAGACFAKELVRAFWAGFALFGITYLVLVDWDWIGGQFGHDLTGGLNDVANLVFPPPPPTAMPGGSPRPPVVPPWASAGVREQQIGNFVQIGRLVLTLACAFAGGLIARRFAARAAARSEP